MTDQALVNFTSHDEMSKFANNLKTFIVKQSLFTPIQGKNYVNVEGWEYAGACMGILPVVSKLEDLSTENETKFRAEVELKRLSDQSTIGSGVAVCSSLESKRKNADEYVIASMAQTRAIGKAYRNGFGWLMKLAGYEPTTAEEMDGDLGGSKPNAEMYDKLQAVKTKTELITLMQRMTPTDLKAYESEIQAKSKEFK